MRVGRDQVSVAAQGEVTELLLRWSSGEESALEQLVPIVYAELRRLAHRYMRGERVDHTLQTSALINEAYLRLVDSGRVKWRGRGHFLAISSQLMRRVLVDFARSRRSQKRGSAGLRIPLDVALELYSGRTTDLVWLDDALNELAQTSPRRSKVIELRFFGGLSVAETAETLGVSEDTVLRDWRLARAELARMLRKVTNGA
jgi:RNA polymerase sigma factor (TIGR02999 family)